MNMLAIIPARGGSKRIPGKNIKEMCGKPIINYPIEVLKNSGLFEEVMVSTEDEKIAEIAKKCGAQIPFMRSLENSSDHSSTISVINEVCKKYLDLGKTFDYVCVMYPTSILVQNSDLKTGIEKLKSGKFQTVLATTDFSYSPLRAYQIVDQDCVEFKWPEYEMSRSQDLPRLMHDAGMFYWMKWDDALNAKSVINKPVGYVDIPNYRAQDIDTYEDWKIAEIKLELLQKDNN